MAPDYAEASDIAKLGGGLVINIGTAQRKDLRNYIGALVCLISYLSINVNNLTFNHRKPITSQLVQ